MTGLVSVSVVSHGQIALAKELLGDIAAHCDAAGIEVILTLNIPEELPFCAGDYPFALTVIRNLAPKGFGANHNQAFRAARGGFFCVLNPDIRFDADPLPALRACLADRSVGVAAPLVLGSDGGIEDSARRFPSPLRILCKVFGGCRGGDYAVGAEPIHPDWAGGMFLLFPRSLFERLGGFDERYFLYYEDVDICARLRLLGQEVLLCPRAKVVHHARRSSHRSFRYLRWHLKSMMRFFLSPVYWRSLFASRRGARK